jgi:branched-chain amino acid transport system ATP-binding protein
MAGDMSEAMSDVVSDVVLELQGVCAAYDSIEVLHGVDLVLPPGQVLAVLGPNGAGKTTMLNVVAGLHAPTKGSIYVAGRRVNGAGADELARRGLCTIPEGRGVFANLTVRENLWMATHRGVPLASVEEATYARFPLLKERRHQPAGTLSGGEQQMLAVARAISTRPALLLLDELSMGLAPLIVEELYDAVARIAAEGTSILIVEQFAKTVLDVADLAAIMVQGRIAHVGRPVDVQAQLHAAYLGGGALTSIQVRQ